MKVRIVFGLAVAFLCALPAAAQHTKLNSSSSSPGFSPKLVSLFGTVGAAGNTFIAEKNKSLWAVANPEVLLENVGDHVRILAHLDPLRHQLQAVSVELDPRAGARLGDAAFRR